MGQSTEELTNQIEDTRQRMASDLDTLQDRVSPSAIVQRRKEAAYGRVASAKNSIKDKVMGSADATQERYEGAPVAAGLAAFGAGMVVAALLPASRLEAEAAHRVVETAKEHGQPLVDDARAAGEEVVETVKQSTAESAQQLKESAQDSAEAVRGEM